MSNREARMHARLRKRRIRAGVYILISAGVLGLAGSLIRSAFVRPIPLRWQARPSKSPRT